MQTYSSLTGLQAMPKPFLRLGNNQFPEQVGFWLRPSYFSSLSSLPNKQPSPSWVPSAMPGMKTHCITTDRAQERDFNQLPPKHRAAIHVCQQTELCGIWTVLTSSFFNEFFKGICVPKMDILETQIGQYEWSHLRRFLCWEHEAVSTVVGPVNHCPHSTHQMNYVP